MTTKIKWLLVAGIFVLSVVALKGYRITPKPVSPESRQKLLDELVAANPWTGGLTPDRAGNTLAYLVETDVGRRVVLVDLKTLTKREIPTTNEVKTIFGWSSDDRHLAFAQLVPKTVDARKGAAKAIDFWLTIYDRQTDTFRRLTEEANVAEVKFFWLRNDSFLWANRRLSNGIPQYGGWMLGNLQEPNGEKVSDFIPELNVITESTAVIGTTDLSILELKPLQKTETGWDEKTKVVQKKSDFKTNDFTGLKWVNFSEENGHFLFCSRPSTASWRFLYRYDPDSKD